MNQDSISNVHAEARDKRTEKTPAGGEMTRWRPVMGLTVQVMIILLSLVLVASLVANQADASPVFFQSSSSQAERKATNLASQARAQQQSPAQHPKPAASYNNIENLISELLDDVGNRLKKSKLHSVRQIKQTLRFGRSDPYMAPTSSDDEYELQQQERDAYEASGGNN